MEDSLKNRWLSPETALKILAILVIGAIVVVSLVREKIVANNDQTVNVAGEGKVSYVPDIANITLGAQVDKVKKADEALNQLNGIINKVIPAIKKLGIAEEDISTENYTLTAQYDVIDNVSAQTGYSANQQLTVKVKNFTPGSDQVSKVIAEASKAGANQVIGITFDSSDAEALKQEARVKAISDARSKAGALADAAGVRLGKVIGWWENIIAAPGAANQSLYGKGGAGMDASIPSIPSGNQEVVVEINLNYRVK